MIPSALAPVVAHLWQSTLFAAVAALLTLALRRNQARVRYWIWLAASCKFLVPFSWLVSFGHLFQLRSAPAVVPYAFTTATEAVSAPVLLISAPATQAVAPYAPTLLIVIAAVWAGGFFVVVGGWLREWLRIRAIVRAASSLSVDVQISDNAARHSEEPALSAGSERGDEASLPLSVIYREIPRFARNDGIVVVRAAWNDKPRLSQHALRVVSTPARIEPGVFGIFRPVLLLPDGIASQLTQTQLQAVIAHELCHVRRRDNLTAALHMLVEAAFWFYPVVWWLGARLIDERERACDEEVLQAGSEARPYAESILKVCEFYLESPLTCLSGVTGSDLKKRLQRIVELPLGASLSKPKKLLLVIASVAALAVPVIAGVLASQSATRRDLPSFEVASVKINKSGQPSSRNNIPTFFSLDTADVPTTGLLAITNMPFRQILGFAFKLNYLQSGKLLAGLPKEIDSEKFDVEARAAGTPGTDQIRLMVQSLLADRFKLAFHNEMRELPVYALVLAKAGKTGSQLIPHLDGKKCADSLSKPPARGLGDAPQQFPCCNIFVLDATPTRQRIIGGDLTMPMLAAFLGIWPSVERPVVDRTGVSGNFDVYIDTARPGPPHAAPPGVNAEDSDLAEAPSIFTALQEQLGLKVESTRAPVDVLVTDHIEEPPELTIAKRASAKAP